MKRGSKAHTIDTITVVLPDELRGIDTIISIAGYHGTMVLEYYHNSTLMDKRINKNIRTRNSPPPKCY